ncbi:MAG: sulfotransferase family 2 domain-containing protein [Roseibium sp.]|nr:sulfotransferase family 2 domain-containing protein [Roseibium sp.]
MDDYQIKNFLKFAPAMYGLARKPYLFIHIPKNGGMSIRHAPQLADRVLTASRRRLKSRAYADAVLQTMRATGDHPGYEHARLRDVDATVRKAARPFAIVRNPWSRVVSRYTFALQVMDTGNAPENYAPRDFEAFLDDRLKWDGKPYFWHRAVRGWYPQTDYVVNEAGDVAADILRLENFDADAERYFGLPGSLERRNITLKKRLDYKDYFDKRTIQIVADWYAPDIETFGFDFDTMAKKGTVYDDG